MKYIIDANNIAYMCLFTSGINSENHEDENVQGLFYAIFLNKLFSIAKNVDNRSLILAWDSPSGTKWRKEIYPAYKQHRKKSGDHPELGTFFKILLPTLKELLTNFPLNSIEHPKCEGDDLIYALCRYFKEEEKTILSSDGDLTQLYLFFDKIEIYNPRFKRIEKNPGNDFIKLKSIIGDTSDNIGGVYRIGEKTAPDYLSGKKHFNDIQEMEYQKCLKIIDLSQFEYADEVLKDLPNMLLTKFTFNPDDVELFMIEHNMKEQCDRWGVNREIFLRD
jgi:DNA polymerase-1